MLQAPARRVLSAALGRSGEAPSTWVPVSPAQSNGYPEPVRTERQCELVGEWDCACVAPTVRLVKSITPQGKVRVMVTNLTPEQLSTAGHIRAMHTRGDGA